MSHLQDGSRPRQSAPASNMRECTDCGNSYLARAQKCPLCGSSRAQVTEQDVTKKAFGAEDNDLKKAF